LITSFTIACASIGLIGQPGLSMALLTAAVFIAGWCVIGSQNGVNALAATYYPTYLRSTGVGWGLGVGRVGAIVGPVIGGEFLRLQWSTNEIFLAAALPALVSAAAIFSLRTAIKPPTVARA
jgi:AAHS family 4-hydroxybenzoate transporter-like MFS transporter